MVLLVLMGFVQQSSGVQAANPYRDYVIKRLIQHSGQVSKVTAQPSAEIVGGTIAGPEVHRFQAALLAANQPSNAAAFYCGGSVYRGWFVITAAHCSDFVDPKSVRVLAGARRLDSGGRVYKVKSIRVHPKWNPLTFDYDIAIWTLTEKVPDMPVLRLAKSDPPVGMTQKVTGWGSLVDGSVYPLRLHQVQVPVVGRANCNDGNSYRGLISQRMMCAGYAAGGKDSCYGDSGGPLTRPRPEGGRILTGIVSWGTGCALPELYGVYTRVSNPEIRAFIAQMTWPWPLQ